MIKIILASGSPRRKKILNEAGFQFKVDIANVNETIDKKLSPLAFAKKISFEKAKKISHKYKEAIIIAADTIISFDNQAIGKPKNKGDAKKILRKLRGKKHYVITAFTILNTKTGKKITRAERSAVFMRNYSDQEIDEYIATGEPLDKAGAYAIQELGGALVAKTSGDYSNIIGLPIKLFLQELTNFL